MKNILMAAVAVTAIMVSGCQGTVATGDDAAKTEASMTTDQRDIGNRGAVMMAIQGLDRTDKDKENDEMRKAAEVLEFAGIWPGMTVVEMEAGSGYYTDLMSRIVGENGKIIMQNPTAFDVFITAETMEARLAPLSNVTLTKTNFDHLEASKNSADVVTWFLGPHELFYIPDNGVALGDAEKTYAEIFRVLKPGGNFIVLDHAAAEGTPETSGGDTHRIDPATVRAHAEKAGLVFVSSSKALANAEDDHTLNVFNPEIRRKTDRFLHKYTKPK
ncbi:MAG: hypothetical protein COA69_07740 [Robiginitomaculum sp.]|nr:MAG: hypothetical protein COA69_07740 [Robiginitomaculum sp.]